VIELSEYELRTLRQDGEFILLRGQRRHQNGASAPSILAVTPLAERPGSANRRRLEHEYSLRDELDEEWAVRPLALSQHEGRTTLVLDDPGGQPLDLILDGPMELAPFLALGASLATALSRLHSRGLIHKDVKPANVMADPAAGRAWLMGFGIASSLPRERQSLEPAESIAGTLAYMAPEQTGRMNRSIDSRSDLYSLGVTLYQMVTGSLPFAASAPMEWVHSHIARQPVPPSKRLKGIPGPVSAIIMRLLAKTAEKRYQTATAAALDLRRCQAEWKTRRRIAAFPPGKHDVPNLLFIPEKLYGRAKEIDALLASFDRVVASGATELVLVSGYSGVGKSSVVHELHKSLVPPQGLFASGKFDQYQRDIPYATLAQAFQGLIRAVLGKSDVELCQWRDALREALGPNGRLITDLVPDLKHIIGEQPPVPELPPQDAQGRFQLMFRRFISVFARPEHPLALFLDDLQWLDAATLDLLEDLVTRPEVRHLLLIGAFRDNEVNSAHPLMRKLGEIRRAGVTVQEILLAPLAERDLGRLLADTLHCGPERVASLAELIHEKTAGNPFFAIHFISALAGENLLTFDHAGNRWQWDLDRIRAKGYTDNVVDLMVGTLRRLPAATQKALQQLSCLGNSAEFAVLAAVYEDSKEELYAALQDAVRTGLVLRSERGYRFLHDRVQEAAYSLIPEAARGAAHLRIGRLLAANTPPEAIEDQIFEIVSQLNRGSRLITSAEEKQRVAELNLRAGRRAKSSTAYAAALAYLSAGLGLLTEESWRDRYDLIFHLELYAAECELLTASLLAAEARLSRLAHRARDRRHFADVARLRLTLYTTLDRSDRAVEVFLEYLRREGTDWSPHPTPAEVQGEFDRIVAQIGRRTIAELIDLPLMTDRCMFAALDVLTEMVTPALFTDVNLLSLVICRMVNLSLEHGNSDGSCFAYVWLGMIAGPHFHRYDSGYQFGRLGYDLVEKRGLRRLEARTYMSFGNLVIPWTKHVRTGRELVRRAFDTANRIGDLTFAAYSCNNLNTNLLAAGDALGEVQAEVENGLAFAQKARFGTVIDVITTQLALVRTLRGLTPKFGCFDQGPFQELAFERHLAGDVVLALPECWYWIRKLQARYFAGDYAAAVQAASRAQRLLWTSPSFFETAEYHFYGALALAAACDSAAAGERERHLGALAAHQAQLKIWAENCPENFANRTALVAAEIARLDGREVDAMRHYEQAVVSARDNGFIQNEAVAHELAAKYYAARGSATAACAHLEAAHGCFAHWGADGKVRQLERLHPRLRDRSAPAAADGNAGTSIEQLDVGTVIKASQALSSEMVLGKLIETLLRLAVEHAGAERGLLILVRGDELQIEAEATTGRGSIEVHVRKVAVTSADLPVAVLNYVIRTRSRVVLEDAFTHDSYGQDEYVLKKRARAALCLPVIKQTQLVGALYLENNLTPGAFTADRVAVLELLASQAAISLENARLYFDLQRSEDFLAKGQSINSTGSFGWNTVTGELYWSAQTYRIYEYDRAVKPTLELALARIHPEDRAARQQFAAPPSDARTNYEAEFRLLMPDGRVKHVQILAHAARDAAGNVEFVGLLKDITAARAAAEALRRTQSDLAHASRVTTMGELAASIAHEVNQPLTAVMNNANACLSLLPAGSANFDDIREALAEIVEDADRAGAVVARVRRLVRKAPFEKALQDLREVITDVLELIRPESAARGVTIRTEFSETLPLIMGDRVQLQQVLLNLAVNGLDAMSTIDEADRLLTIGVHPATLEGKPAVAVSVRDAGTGFKPEDKDRLFEAFYTTKPQGTGLGLAISRSIIEAHGGRLWAQANPGPGATFIFEVPAAGGEAS
jgi:predicted ATPase/signal transduction histidine kinase